MKKDCVSLNWKFDFEGAVFDVVFSRRGYLGGEKVAVEVACAGKCDHALS